LLLAAAPKPDIISLLIRQLLKPHGVYFMILSFSIGEGKEKMKDFAIKIIGSYPA
jgi:hypothetical protein